MCNILVCSDIVPADIAVESCNLLHMSRHSTGGAGRQHSDQSSSEYWHRCQLPSALHSNGVEAASYHNSPMMHLLSATCKHAEHTSGPLVSILVLEPRASLTSMDSVLFSSQLRAVNANGLDVSAPTGQRSITLPDSSLVMSFSTYVPISESRPLPVIPKSCTPEASHETTQQQATLLLVRCPHRTTLPPMLCIAVPGESSFAASWTEQN